MTTSSTGFSGLHQRLTHLFWYFVVLTTALLLALLQPAAWAQEPAPLDPPGRVARLNLAEGEVSLAPADSNAWTPALLNRPLTSGDRLWTGPRARAELHVGSTALRLSEQTSLDFLTLDDNVAQLRLAQGTLQLRVRALFEGQRLEVDTPNLAFVISEPGNYRLDVSPASDSTRVVVQSGSGVIYGDGGAAVNLGSQQQASYTGTQLVPAAPGPAWLDSFDDWAADRDRREDESISARYIPRETIGYQQLDAYGDWRHDPVYGAVWLPRAVPVNWAPYRMGHWDWIAPWGWTWIDDAPWGFAPFHYGRWTLIGLHWAWVPGRLPARPVYAPALVVFVGGLKWSISIGSAGLAPPALGWFPLAPGEAFRPHYRVSPRYFSQVNQNIVVNSAVNVTNVYRYQRQPAAVTAVKREDFTRGRPVRGNQHVLSATDLRRARVVAERSALPQRPDVRERTRPVAPAALPPAAVITRPVVRSREGRRDESRAGRPDNRDRTIRTQPPLPAAPVTPGVTAAQPPALRSVPAPAQDRSAIDAEQRSRREQQQLQRDQQRQQRELTRQQPPRDQQRQQSEASPGPRALRAPVENKGNARPVVPDARDAAERNSALQAERAQQQLQRDQRRQQAEQVRQQEQQRRQSEEALGQRALREQAQKQQEQARQQQQQAQQRQARELQQQQQLEQRKEQAQQRQAREQQQLQRTQQDRQRQEQAAQAQKQAQQQELQRQAREQQQQQQQPRAQQDQQRQARELQQRQQMEQRKEQAEERKKARQTDAATKRPPRPEGEPIRNREP